MARQVDQLAWYALHHGEEVAYADLATGAALTFGEWWRRASSVARSLVEDGVRPGDRVGIHLDGDHVLDWIAAYPAVHLARAVAVPTNTRLTAPELSGILRHAEPDLVITSSALAPVVEAARSLLGVDTAGAPFGVVDVDDPEWGDRLAAEPLVGSADPPPDADGDLADIMYTSGTTGLPKGIAVRHRNTHIIPNGSPDWRGDSWIHCSPLFTFAGMAFIYNPMKMGMAGLYLPRFDVDEWVRAVEVHRPSMAFLVPAMVQLLLASPSLPAADLTSLRMLSIGSAPLPPSLHLAMADRLPNASVSNNYSMTEAGTTFTFMPHDELRRRPGSVGIPMGSELRIVDDDGADLPPGEIGEILIGVGKHHREYYLDPEATAAAWSGGWLRSGDLGELDDDGYLYLRGRKKDLIIRGGHNILATDVESVLYRHPDVLEAAVVGFPHEVLGEDVAAFVVPRPGTSIDPDEVRSFCAPQLADYKVPRRVVVVEALPRNATGKVLKAELVVPVITPQGDR